MLSYLKKNIIDVFILTATFLHRRLQQQV